MYVRLAFAVAAHLEPEILVIDEVLAVGDAAFQRKCTEKMEDAATAGHTVLFVSHNLSAVRNLCHRTVWLQDGAMVQDGETGAVADAYLRQNLRGDTTQEVKNRICALPADADFCLTDVAVTQDGTTPPAFANGKPIRVEIRYTVSRRVSGLRVYFDLLDDDQDILLRSFHDSHEAAVPVMNPGRYLSVAEIPAKLLAPRRYDLRICAGIFNVRSCMGDGILLPLTVHMTSGINRAYPSDPHRAKLEPEIPWETVGLA
jgi:lipopolysaccharide transport system ATP-binding protein